MSSEFPRWRITTDWVREWLGRGPSKCWLKDLLAAKRVQRIALEQALRELGAAGAVLEEGLRRALEHDEPDVRAWAERSLAAIEVHVGEANEPVSVADADPPPVTALVPVRAVRAEEAILAAFRSADETLRLVALRDVEVSRCSHVAIFQEIVVAVYDASSPVVRLEAIRVLGETADRWGEAVPVAAGLLYADDADVQAAALRAICAMGAVATGLQATIRSFMREVERRSDGAQLIELASMVLRSITRECPGGPIEPKIQIGDAHGLLEIEPVRSVPQRIGLRRTDALASTAYIGDEPVYGDVRRLLLAGRTAEAVARLHDDESKERAA